MEFNRILLFLFISIVVFLPEINSQQQNYFTHLTVEDGLSQSSVFSITQDETGFIWFATEDGLNKYDGYKFTVYRPIENDPNSLPDLGIRKVFEDKSGNIWVITLRGKICLYDQQKDNFKTYSFSDAEGKQRKIISIGQDKNGILWIASTRGDLFSFNSKKNLFEKFILKSDITDKFKSIHLQSLLIDSDNLFWIGTWEGLINLNIESQTINWYKHSDTNSNSIGGDMVFSLSEDRNKNIWIASANGGVSVYSKSDKMFKVYHPHPGEKNSVSSNRIMCILVDSRNKVWIGSFDKGLDLFDPLSKSIINYSHNPSVPGSFSIGAVMCIYEDKSGGIWIGTGGGGINRYDLLNQNFNHIQFIPGNKSNISPNPVLAVCEDQAGNLLIGTDGGGINFREKNSDHFITYLKNPEFGSNAITVIYEDSKNNIWVGADPGTSSPAGVLLKFDKKNKTFIPVKEVKIKLGGIAAIKEDKYGELWIATPSDGIHRYNPKTRKEIVYNYDPDNPGSISSNSIFSICEDSFGNMWFGSIASGLNLYSRETDSFKRFVYNPKDNHSIGSNAIWCICEDLNKDLWIGTWGGGINKYDRTTKQFFRYTTRDGLPGNVVYNIVPDNLGNLWIASNKSLSRFNSVSKKIRNFGKPDGLLINDFSAGAFFKTKDGRLYFGGNSGVVVFDPEKIVENNYIPNVAVTGFKVYDSPIKSGNPVFLTNEVFLNYDQNFFTIEFAAFDYAAPERNQFEYMLEGVDKNWIHLSGKNYASYTDIAHGNYTFRLKGSNSSGKYSNKEIALSIIIAPPFWKTWWFRLAALIILVLLLYSLHKYRLNKLLEVERTRNRIARDLHDEVSASITGIVYFADAIKEELNKSSSSVTGRLLNMISESAAQIQESISDIIWSINPDNDDWSVVLPKFRRFASDICESKNIIYEINIPENFVGRSLRMEHRHDLWLVFKEIVTNSVKHSKCTDLEIKLYNDSEFLYLDIEDNGSGFDPSIPSPNNGIKNIKTRINSLKGNCELASEIGKGTKWSIKIPLNRN